jgi:hypothetical protein
MLGSGPDASKDMLAQYVRQLLDADENRQRSQLASLSTYARKSGDGPADEIWNKSSAMPRANTDVSSSASVSTYYGTRSSDGASSGGGYSPDSPENSENSGSEATSCAAVAFQGPPPGLGSFADAQALPSSQKVNVQHCSQQLQHATGVLQAALANWEAALQSEEVRTSASSTIPSDEDVHVLEPVTVPLPSKFVSPCVSATTAAAPPSAGSSTNVNVNAQGLAQLHKAIGALTSTLQGENQTPAGVGAAAENKAASDANMQAMKLLRQHVDKQQKESAIKVQKLLQEQQRQLAAEALSNALAAAAADVFATQRQAGEAPWSTPAGVANLQQHLAAFGHPSLAGAAGLQYPPGFGLGAAAGMPAPTSPLAGAPIARNPANLAGAGGLANAVGFGGMLENRHSQPAAFGASVAGMPHMQAALWSAQMQAQQQAQQHAQQQVQQHVQQQAMLQRPAKMPPRQGNNQQHSGNNVPKGGNNQQHIGNNVPKGGIAPTTMPPRRGGVPAPKAPGGEEETLRTHLRDLQKVEAERVVLVRKINRLGFDSPAALEAHYSRYGTVERILVAHSHVKSQNRRIAARLRPSGLGFVVMGSKEEVEAILSDGPEQMVSGALIRVQIFTRCCGENLDGGEDLLNENDAEAGAVEETDDVASEPVFKAQV